MRVDIPEKNTYIDFPEDASQEEVSQAIDSNWDNIKGEERSFLSDVGKGTEMLGKGALALGEMGAAAGTGIIGMTGGVVAALPALALGEPEAAKNIMGKVSSALTYQPKSELARQIWEPPMEALSKGLALPGRAFSETGYPKTGAAVDVLTQAALVATPFLRGRGARVSPVHPADIALEKTGNLYTKELPPGIEPRALLEAPPPPSPPPDWIPGRPKTIREPATPSTAEGFKGPDQILLRTKTGEPIEATWNPETKRYEPVPAPEIGTLKKPYEEPPTIIGEDISLRKRVEEAWSKPAFQRTAEDILVLKEKGPLSPAKEEPSFFKKIIEERGSFSLKPKGVDDIISALQSKGLETGDVRQNETGTIRIPLLFKKEEIGGIKLKRVGDEYVVSAIGRYERQGDKGKGVPTQALQALMDSGIPVRATNGERAGGFYADLGFKKEGHDYVFSSSPEITKALDIPIRNETIRSLADPILNGNAEQQAKALGQIKTLMDSGTSGNEIAHNVNNELINIATKNASKGAPIEAEFNRAHEAGQKVIRAVNGIAEEPKKTATPLDKIISLKMGEEDPYAMPSGKQIKNWHEDFPAEPRPDLATALKDTTTGKIYTANNNRIPHPQLAEFLNRNAGIAYDHLESGWIKEGKYARTPAELKAGGGEVKLFSNPLSEAARLVKEKIIDPILNLKTSEGDTLRDWTIRKIQDKYLPLKQIQERITGPARSLVDRLNTYRAEELRSGKTFYALDLADHTITKPFVDALKTARKSGISLDDLDAYLTAKHAPERNATIQARNERFVEGGSGMTDAEARAVLDNFDAKGKTTELEGLAKKIWDINKTDWDLRRKYGLISEELYQAKLKEWKHYVPLRGKEGLPERPNIGQGVSVKTGFKGAMGRRSMADSPVLNSLGQLEETIIRGEKNKVGNVFLDFVQTGLKNGWLGKDDVKINAVSEKARFNPKTGQVEFVNAPDSWAKSQDVFTTLKDGTPYAITIENNPLLVRALKNLGADKSGKIIQTLSMFNRYLAMIKTSLNLEFAATNPVRDAMTGTLNLSIEKSTAMARSVLKDLPRAMVGAYRGFKFELGTKWAKYADEYRAQGGAIGFYSMKDLESRGRIIETELAAAEGKIGPRTAQVFRNGLNVIKDLTGAGENALRLSAYVNARKAGYSQAQAASLSKNLTVNFNRRGEWGPLMNASYMFFNANVQGTARFLQAAKNNPKRFAAYGSAALGLSLAVAELNRSVMGEDKDGINYYDKIDANTKSRNLIIPNPLGGKKDSYLKIPLAYGYNIFHAMGQTIDSMANDKQKKVGTGVLELGAAMSDAFNPLGNTGNFISGISPTILDPAVELAMNRNWAGIPIRPEEMPFAAPKPESQRYFKSVTGVSKTIAQGINTATGGNEARPGTIDLSPEWIDYMTSYFLGGAGDVFRRSADVISRVYNGEEIPIKDVPLVRRFAGEKSEYFDTQKFIENLKEAQTNLEEYKRYGKAQDEGMLGFAKMGQSLQIKFGKMHQAAKKAEEQMPPAEAKAFKKELEQMESEGKLSYNKDVMDYVRSKTQTQKREETHPVLTEQMTPFRRNLQQPSK